VKQKRGFDRADTQAALSHKGSREDAGQQANPADEVQKSIHPRHHFIIAG